MRGPLSLRMRLTVWYTLVLLVVVGGFGADVIWGERRVGMRRVDGQLEEVVTGVAAAVTDGLGEHAPVKEAAERACHAASLSGTDMAIFDSQGTLICGQTRLAASLGVPAAGRLLTTVEHGGSEWRVLSEPHAFGDQRLIVRASESLADVRRAQHEVLEAMQVAIPLVLLLAGGGGFWLASIGLGPITQMARAATEMAPGATNDLGHADRPDELGQLARAFNGLLSRVRGLLTSQRQFMADASHELRTPVSVIRSAADVVLARDTRTESEYREALSIAGAQARHLSRLVEQMLVLARADAGGYPMRFVDLYLEEVIEQCRQTVAGMAEAGGVTVNVCEAGELAISGDEELLRQLVLNVLQNAVQHTPRGGRVTVHVQLDAAQVVIRVTDTGTGIAPADQARIFDRFVQLDPARRHLGAGLGLPIARWIAEAHGGSLTLEQSSPSGSTFRIVLPREAGASR